MTGFKSKRAAALDEDGMYLVHQTTPVKFNCTVVDDQHPQGIPLEQWGNPPAAQPAPAGYIKKIEDLIIQRDKWKDAAQRKPLTKEHGFINYAHQLMVKCFNKKLDEHLEKKT